MTFGGSVGTHVSTGVNRHIVWGRRIAAGATWVDDQLRFSDGSHLAMLHAAWNLAQQQLCKRALTLPRRNVIWAFPPSLPSTRPEEQARMPVSRA